MAKLQGAALLLLSLAVFARALDHSSAFWNISTSGPGSIILIPLQNGQQYRDITITAATHSIIGSSTYDYDTSEQSRVNFNSSGTWRLESSVVPTHETPGIDYTAPVPLLRRDLIWEQSFSETGNIFQWVISFFNDTTTVLRTGGLPVEVSPATFKMNFVMTNWTFPNAYASVDLESNILTNDTTTVQLHYPTNLTSTEPFSLDVLAENIWSYRMIFQRWTMFDGVRSSNGKVLPHFPASPSDDYYTRNIRNVSITYHVTGYSNIEYDPTGLFSIFQAPIEAPNSPNKAKKVPLGAILGSIFGVVALVAIIALVSIFVPQVRSIIRPFTNRTTTGRTTAGTVQ